MLQLLVCSGAAGPLWFRYSQCSQQRGVRRTESLVFASAHLDDPTLPPVGQNTYCKSRFRITQTLSLCVCVCYLSVLHDQNTICVHHSVDTMGDGEHGAVLEGFVNCVLDQGVCLCIDGCCCLIQKNDLVDNRRVS